MGWQQRAIDQLEDVVAVLERQTSDETRINGLRELKNNPMAEHVAIRLNYAPGGAFHWVRMIKVRIEDAKLRLEENNG